MEQFMWIVWLALFVLALLIEWATSEVVSIWFAAGSLVALILSLIPGVYWWIQLIVFVVISFASFLFLRPLFKRLLKREKVNTNVDELIGKVALMISNYDELNHGTAKVCGVVWTVVNTKEKEPLNSGEKVKVLAIEGNKLIVKKIIEEEN